MLITAPCPEVAELCGGLAKRGTRSVNRTGSPPWITVGDTLICECVLAYPIRWSLVKLQINHFRSTVEPLVHP